VCSCAALAETSTEETNPYPRRSPLTDTSAPESDPFQRRGFNWGHLKLLPTFTYDLTYTDNSTRSPVSPQQDLVSEYGTGIELNLKPSETRQFMLKYDFGWHDYLQNTARDYASHRATTETRVRNILVEGLEFLLTDTYAQTVNQNALEREVLFFSRYDTDTAAFRTQYEYNRFAISGRYAYSFVDYFARRNSTQDYQTHTGELEASYALLPRRTILFGNYSVVSMLRAIPVEDFTTQTWLAGIRGTYSRLDYSLSAGYRRVEFTPVHQSDGGPVTTLKLAYAPHTRLGATLEVSRQFVEGVLTGTSTDTIVNASVMVALTRRGKLTAGYVRNDSEHKNGLRDVTLAYNAAFEYKLTRFASATWGFTRSERQFSSGSGSFAADDVRVGVRLAW
jgi:hypothetical protein